MTLHHGATLVGCSEGIKSVTRKAEKGLRTTTSWFRRLRKPLVVMRALAAIALIPSLGLAQAAYPERTVRLLVGFAPGGATDTIAREIARGLSQVWGQQVVVENKAGAGGTIAADSATRAQPDGYTLFLTSDSAIVSAPFTNKDIAYDPLTHLKPISLVSGFPLVLVAHPSLGVNTLPELLSVAKADPGGVAYASTGVGTSSHLPMERLQQAAGVLLNHIPYKGGTQAMVDLLAGQAPLMLNTVTMTAQYINSGELVLLAVGSRQRLPQFPDTPAVAELGFPDFEAGNWIGIMGPGALPDELATKINQDIQKVIHTDAYRKRMETLGFDVRPSTPKEFAALIQDEYSRNKKIFAELSNAPSAK